LANFASWRATPTSLGLSINVFGVSGSWAEQIGARRVHHEGHRGHEEKGRGLGCAEVSRKDAKTQRELGARRVISRRRRDTEVKAAKFGRKSEGMRVWVRGGFSQRR
jgi:hypothetical protein